MYQQANPQGAQGFDPNNMGGAQGAQGANGTYESDDYTVVDEDNK
jgi:hypothetical protein